MSGRKEADIKGPACKKRERGRQRDRGEGAVEMGVRCRQRRYVQTLPGLLRTAGGSASLSASPATDAGAQTEINPLWAPRCQRTHHHRSVTRTHENTHTHTRTGGALTNGISLSAEQEDRTCLFQRTDATGEEQISFFRAGPLVSRQLRPVLLEKNVHIVL